MVYSQNEIMKKFGAKVKHYRELAGFTQEQLAEKCDCSAQTISGTETGYSFPSSKTLFNLAFALNVPLVYLFNFDDNKKISKNEFSTTLNRLLNKLDSKEKELVVKIIKVISEE